MKKTHITLVVDRSGSIQTILNDFQGGLNKFLEDQKNLGGECTLTLIDFDTEYQKVYSGDIKDVPSYQVIPRGMTALRDAVGRAINETGEFLNNMPESDRPELVLMAIITDGKENSSREFSIEKIKEMVEHQKTKYNWVFDFLCADEQTVMDGLAFGFNSSASYDPTIKSANAYSNLSMKTCVMRSCSYDVNSSEFQQLTSYTDEQKKDMS